MPGRAFMPHTLIPVPSQCSGVMFLFLYAKIIMLDSAFVNHIS